MRRDQIISWLHENAERATWAFMVVVTGLLGWTLGLDAGASSINIGMPVVGVSTTGIFGARVAVSERWVVLMRSTIRLSMVLITLSSTYAALLLLTKADD